MNAFGLFTTFRGSQCKYRVDKVSGLQGLARSCYREQIVIDYLRSAFEVLEATFQHYRHSKERKEVELMLQNCQFYAAFSEPIQELIPQSLKKGLSWEILHSQV